MVRGQVDFSVDKYGNECLSWVNEFDKIYQDHGYDNRTDYLKSLIEYYDLDEDQQYVMYMTADLLGHGEDFDGLISFLDGIA